MTSFSFFTKPLEYICRDRDYISAFLTSSSTIFHSSIIPSIFTQQTLWKTLSTISSREAREHTNPTFREQLPKIKFFKTKTELRRDKKADPDYVSDNDTDDSDEEDDGSLHYARPAFITKRDILVRIFRIFKHCNTLQFTHSLQLESEFCGNDPSMFVEFEVLTPLLVLDFEKVDDDHDEDFYVRLALSKPPSDYFYRTLKHFQFDFLSPQSLNLILQHVVSLESLNLQHCQTCLNDPIFIAKHLIKPPFACSNSLMYLNLQSIGVNIDETLASKFICQFPQLRHLLLGGNYGISRRGLEQIRGMKKLLELDLAGMKMQGTTVMAANQDTTISTIQSSTHTFSVFSPPIRQMNHETSSAQNEEQLLAPFYPMSSLATLCIDFCHNINDNDMKLLATDECGGVDCLLLTDTLRTLKMSNLFGATSACLKQSVSKLTNLTHLDLQQLENAAGDYGQPWALSADEVSDALSNLVNLRYLDVSGSPQVCDRTMKFLETNQKYYKESMEHLDFTETSVTGVTLRRISEFVKLKYLSMRAMSTVTTTTISDSLQAVSSERRAFSLYDFRGLNKLVNLEYLCLERNGFAGDDICVNDDFAFSSKFSQSSSGQEEGEQLVSCWLSNLRNLHSLLLFGFKITDHLIKDFAHEHVNPSSLQSIAIFDNESFYDPRPLTRFTSLRKLRLEKCVNVKAKLLAESFTAKGSFPNLEKINFTGTLQTKEDVALIESCWPKFVDVLLGVS